MVQPYKNSKRKNWEDALPGRFNLAGVHWGFLWWMRIGFWVRYERGSPTTN
jgi:hypothetical protein